MNIKYYWNDSEIDRFSFKHLICSNGLLNKFERFEKSKKAKIFFDHFSKLKAVKTEEDF